MPRSVVTVPALKHSSVTGINEIRAKLAEVIDKTSAESLKDSVFWPAGKVLFDRLASAISLHSPSKGNKKFPAGTLRDGLFMTRGKSGKQNRPNVLVGISGKGRANYLALWLEHGTFKQPPRPFFRPTVLAAKPELAEMIAVGLKNALDEATQ